MQCSRKYIVGFILTAVSLCLAHYYWIQSGSPLNSDYTFVRWFPPIHQIQVDPDVEKKRDDFAERTVEYMTKDVDDWTRGVMKLHHRFEPQTSKTCTNKCVFQDRICKAKSYGQWEKIRASKDLKPVPLLPKGEYVFPWEREYLSHKPLQDVKTLPDLRSSKIYHLLNGKAITNERTVNATKNGRLFFRVDLVDSYGKARRYGGDEVRTWLSDSNGKRSMSGQVKYQDNGTYLVMVTPTWPGMFQLYVAVTYPREAIRAALHHRREGRYRFTYGLYKSGNVEETTICHTTPNIPGRPCLCNHTDINRRPYYCGRPLDRRLQCKHWCGYRPAMRPMTKDLTSAEAVMTSQMGRKPKAAVIQHSITIVVQDKGQTEQPLPQCIGLDLRATWNKTSPRGEWVDGEWNSFICKEPELTFSWMKKCLRSTHIWMIGDSNMNQIKEEVKNLGFNYCPNYVRWLDGCEGNLTENNSTLTLRGHEHPMFHYVPRHLPLVGNGGIEDFLGKIPSTGNHVVIIHYFLHFTISHLSAIFRGFLATRDAVTDLLARNPSVIVGIRGPHTSAIDWRVNHIFGGDVLGPFILAMMDVVFKDLQDKVVFLDGWDMTISLENTKMHPSKAVPRAMIRTLLSFKCPGSL